MRLPGVKHARIYYRWIRSRLQGRGLILGYHRIAEPPWDPYSICVSPGHFAEQLRVLCRVAHPIHLGDLLRDGDGRALPYRPVVVTFDDGYADVLLHAKPILEEYGVPATVFVTTGHPGGRFWWDELQEIVMAAEDRPDQVITALSAGAPGAEGTPPSREHLLQRLYHDLLPLPTAAREDRLAQIRALGSGATAEGGTRRTLTESELAALALSDLVTIGSHTVFHPMLATLPAAEQRWEICQSRRALEQALQRPVVYFSYPNGSVAELTADLVRRCGYTAACASHNDVWRPQSDRYQLPRFWVPNWDGATFERWLHRWLPR